MKYLFTIISLIASSFIYAADAVKTEEMKTENATEHKDGAHSHDATATEGTEEHKDHDKKDEKKGKK